MPLEYPNADNTPNETTPGIIEVPLGVRLDAIAYGLVRAVLSAVPLIAIWLALFIAFGGTGLGGTPPNSADLFRLLMLVLLIWIILAPIRIGRAGYKRRMGAYFERLR